MNDRDAHRHAVGLAMGENFDEWVRSWISNNKDAQLDALDELFADVHWRDVVEVLYIFLQKRMTEELECAVMDARKE